jgi:hypothetical protein
MRNALGMMKFYPNVNALELVALSSLGLGACRAVTIASFLSSFMCELHNYN